VLGPRGWRPADGRAWRAGFHDADTESLCCRHNVDKKRAAVLIGLQELRRMWRRFVLVGLVVALVAVLSTVLSALASGLVSDGVSGLRGLPFSHLAFEPGAQATFSRSTLTDAALERWRAAGVPASPLGMSFVNAHATDGGRNVDLALFGVPAESYLVEQPRARAALRGRPGVVLASSLQADGIEVGDRYAFGAAGLTLPVLGFTYAGSYGHAPIGFVSLSTWQTIAYGGGDEARFAAIALRVPKGLDIAVVDRAAGTETKTKAQAYAGSPGYSAETGTMSLIRGFLLVISALIVGSFFTVWTIQRTRQVGLLKALGASTAAVLRDLVGQLAIVVGVATLLGTVVGAALAALIEGGDVPIDLTLRSTVLTALLLAAFGLAGSLIAVRRIAGIEPAVALGVEP
jgi:putative ABC transport system permease protein